MRVILNGELYEIEGNSIPGLKVVTEDNFDSHDYRKAMDSHRELREEMLINTKRIRRKTDAAL